MQRIPPAERPDADRRRFSQLKIPFRWVKPLAADRRTHISPEYDALVVRPSTPAGFEGMPMKWGVFSDYDKKTGEPIAPDNARHDKVEGHPDPGHLPPQGRCWRGDEINSALFGPSGPPPAAHGGQAAAV